MHLQALGLILLFAAPQVEVTTLSGQRHAGELLALSGGRLTLQSDGAPLELNAADLLELRVPDAPAPDPFVLDRNIAVRLTDGSLIHATSFSLADRRAVIHSELLGEVRLPLADIRSVRLAEIDNAVRDSWSALQERDSRSDLLVVRKADALDFVGGVVASVADDGVHVLVNNRDVILPAERVFGLVFPRPQPERRDALCEVLLSSGDRLRLSQLTIGDGYVTGTLSAGPEFHVLAASVQLLDFGLGRVRYLADLPETATYKPVGLITSEDVLRVRKNVNSLGRRFVVGKQTCDRGLWIHSGTTLRYRLNRDYRRLQALAGIDQSASGCARLNPRLRAVILADGQTLLDAEIGWGDEPRALDLDVTGVRDLEIRIEPASADSIGACEHLVLADARVIK